MKFSSYEIRELLVAWIAISIAFAILFSGLGGLLTSSFLAYLFISGLTVGIGFLLHELAHKYLAQRYGCWAEFRSDKKMLLVMIALSFFGFIFAAPGAVVIHGLVDRSKHGKISAVGPLTNIILAFLFFLFGSFGFFSSFFFYGFRINAWLGLFNLLPFWQLDGVKVLQWHKGIYFTLLILAGLLTFASGL